MSQHRRSYLNEREEYYKEKRKMKAKNLTIMFYGKSIQLVKGKNGNYWVPVKQICDDIGIDFKKQKRKINDSEVIKGGYHMVPSFGGNQDTYCLRKDYLGFWLATINTRKISNDSIRQKLITYQKEICQVIDDYLSGRMSPDYYRNGHIYRSELLEFCEEGEKYHERIN